MLKTLKYIITILAVLWLVEIVDLLLPMLNLDSLGIHPRMLRGLWGIAAAPFIHGSVYHLAANTVPFAVLSFIVMTTSSHEYVPLFIFTAVAAGLGAWLLGARGSVHVGISGVIFGFLGFLLARGLFTRNLFYISVSIVVAILYGGSLIGIFPGSPFISWQCHLFGFIGGICFAKLSSNRTA